MRCRCGTTFSDDEHRCPRCGRRVQMIMLPDAVTTASALQPAADPAATAEASRTSAGTRTAAPQQPQLFSTTQKIIPFESLVSTRRQYVRRREQPRNSSTSQTSTRITQQALELRLPQADAAPRALYVDAHIAPPGVRARAAFVDLIVCLAGLAAFAAPVWYMTGGLPLSAKTTMHFGIAAGALGFFYHLFFAMLGRNTIGMGCFGLQIATFDGFQPEWGMRVARLLTACLGTLAVGLGLLWAFVDEEGLGWHDLITKTFPTESGGNASLRRR